jgi:RNA polymerase sigma-70 factor (ECF subfamily)
VSNLKEQFLLHRVRVFKDQSAFTQLYAVHKPSVFRFLRAKLPSTQDAEDALNTVFMRAWNYMTRAEVDHASGLIFTIARGVVAEHYGKRKPSVSIETLTEEGKQIASKRQTASDTVVSTELSLAVELLDRLPDEDRDLIILRYMEGMPIAEIAERFQKTPNATRVALHRALKKLRELFHPHV